MVYLIIAGLFVLIGAYMKNKKNVKQRNVKENVVNNS